MIQHNTNYEAIAFKKECNEYLRRRHNGNFVKDASQLVSNYLTKDGYPKGEYEETRHHIKRHRTIIQQIAATEPMLPLHQERHKLRQIQEQRKLAEQQQQTEIQREKQKQFIASPEFLKTLEWRMLRFDALRKYGNKCMCCGATPTRSSKTIINVDHIKPRKFFPELALDINNVQILCDACNHGKANRIQNFHQK